MDRGQKDFNTLRINNGEGVADNNDRWGAAVVEANALYGL